MGLEIALIKRTYIQHWIFLKEKSIVIETSNKEKTKIKSDRIRSITETIFEWDKANQLHNWFRYRGKDGEDNGREMVVSISELSELLDLCIRVKENNHLAEQLLPTLDGYNFGEIEYDEYYFEVIEETIECLEDLISDLSEDEFIDGFYELVYLSSW